MSDTNGDGGRFVATKDSFAVVAMQATDEGFTVTGLTGKPAREEDEAEEQKTS